MNGFEDKGRGVLSQPKRVQLLVLIMGLAMPHVAQPATFIVNSAADAADVSAGDGVCGTGMLTPDGSSECTLRAAVEESNASAPADIVRLPANTYALTLGPISILNNVAIEGEEASTTVITNFDPFAPGERGLFRIGVLGSGMFTTVMISKVTMTGGRGFQEEMDIGDRGSAGGAIIVNEGNSLLLENVTIVGNRAVQGGGIANFGNLTVRRSTIGSNYADGGGINAAGGGGILNGLQDLVVNLRSAHASIENSTIGGDPCSSPRGEGCGNHADKQGGGITNFGLLEIRNSTITGNVYNGTATFDVGGGGITNGGLAWAGGEIVLNNVTLTRNDGLDLPGSGILNRNGAVSASNTLVLENLGPADCAGALTSLGYNWIGEGDDCVITGDLATTVRVDPRGIDLLGPLADNGGPTETHDLFLIVGGPSPVDAGNPVEPGSGGIACERTDQRGWLRSGGALPCDVGALETFSSPPQCEGFLATIIGSPGDDGIFGLGSFYGTAGRDVIHGLGGNDFIRGLGGDDVICGGAGADHLNGQSGNDHLGGGTANDVLIGGSGNDRLFGRQGNDSLFGRRGNDHMDGGPEVDSCQDDSGRNTFISCRRVVPQTADESN